jgi:hypothetical protein
LTDFTSALNGAQRLRYGKRGFDPAVLDNVITLKWGKISLQTDIIKSEDDEGNPNCPSV